MSIDQETLKEYFKKGHQDARIIYLKLQKSGYIARFRNIWGLPAKGFSNKANYQKWHSEFLVKRANKFLANEYKVMEKEMGKKRRQWANGKISFSDIEDFGHKMAVSNPLYKFDYDVETIMTFLHIPERYKRFVEMSLVIKSPPDFYPTDRPMPRPLLHTDPNTGRKELLIQTYGDTKLEDFRSRYFAYQFKRLQPKVYDYGTIKKLGVPNFDIWKQLSDWRDGGKTHSEIRELAKSQLGYFIRYDEDVKTYIKRYKRLIGGTRKRKV